MFAGNFGSRKEAMAGSTNSGRFEVLQALRAAAAAFVVLLHSFYTYAEKISPMDPIAGVGLRYDLATFGVKLFFCISGFIIYKSTISLPPGTEAASFFARRRLIRIVPLYWAVTVFYAAKLAMQGDAPAIADVLRSLLFVPFSDENSKIRPVLGAGWTLDFEVLFYAVLTMTLFFARARRFAIAVSIFSGLLLVHLFGMVSNDYKQGDTAWGLLADPVLVFFIAGMSVAAIVHRREISCPLVTTFRGGMFAMVGGLLAFVIPASILGLDGLGHSHSLPVILLEVVVCFFLVLICVMPYARDEREVVGRCVVAAGDGSYSTYLVHGFIMGPAARAVAKTGLDIGPWVFAIAMVLVCTLVGVFVYRFIEYPMLRRLNEVWGRPNARAESAIA